MKKLKEMNMIQRNFLPQEINFYSKFKSGENFRFIFQLNTKLTIELTKNIKIIKQIINWFNELFSKYCCLKTENESNREMFERMRCMK